MGFTLCPTLTTVSWSSQARGGRWSRRRYPLRPPPLRATGIKLHYIRLLAGIRLVLSITAPANNPTGRRGQTHRRPVLPASFFFPPASRRLLIPSFIHSSLPRSATPLLRPSPFVLFLFLRFLWMAFAAASSRLSFPGAREES